MSFNGLGTFALTYNWVTDRNNGIKILASRMMTQEQDIADGLSGVITKDGQTTVTADIPMATHKITLLAAATLVTDAMNLGQSRTASAQYASVSGSGTYTAGFSPPITAVSDGMALRVYFADTNATTATATFNPDSLGAANIVKAGGGVLAASDIKTGVGLLTRFGSVWYYSSSFVASNALGLTDGGAKASGFTAAINTRYYAAFGAAGTITMPASATAGDIIVISLAGNYTYTFAPNGLKINSSTSNFLMAGNQTVIFTYTGATDGWV